jgi:hypothetical protein
MKANDIIELNEIINKIEELDRTNLKYLFDYLIENNREFRNHFGLWYLGRNRQIELDDSIY